MLAPGIVAGVMRRDIRLGDDFMSACERRHGHHVDAGPT